MAFASCQRSPISRRGDRCTRRDTKFAVQEHSSRVTSSARPIDDSDINLPIATIKRASSPYSLCRPCHWDSSRRSCMICHARIAVCLSVSNRDSSHSFLDRWTGQHSRILAPVMVTFMRITQANDLESNAHPLLSHSRFCQFNDKSVVTLTQRLLSRCQVVLSWLRRHGEAVRQDVVLRSVRVLRVRIRKRRVVAHESAITRVAAEAFPGREVLVWRASMGYVRTLAVYRVREEFDGPHMVAREKHSTRLFDAVLDQR